MSKLLKFLAVVVAALLLFAGVAAWLLSRVDAKAQFEAAASQATGLDVAVLGEVSISLVPALHATLSRVVVRSRGTPLASIGEAEVRVEFRPLLRRELRVQRLALRDINAQIERDVSGQFNFVVPALRPANTTATAVARLAPVTASIAGLSLERTNLRYVDRILDRELSATGCNFDGRDLQLAGASLMLKSIAIRASVACAEVRTAPLVASDVKFSLAARGGVLQIRALQLRLLGGQGSGEIDADLSGDLPLYRLNYAIKQLRLEELLKVLAAEPLGEGLLDFNASVAMQGSEASSLTRTASGGAWLEGRDLKLAIGDLDQKLARYESSQNFNLVDLGAFFVAGPIGPAFTKSYNFASIFRGTRGDTTVRRLVSRWSIQDGIAHAQDVAMATRANRLAVKGSLDFVQRTFSEVSVALLTERGCARVEQQISGSFATPEIKRPSVLGALAGPMKNLFSKAKRLLGLDCQVFYQGSVEP